MVEKDLDFEKIDLAHRRGKLTAGVIVVFFTFSYVSLGNMLGSAFGWLHRHAQADYTLRLLAVALLLALALFLFRLRERNRLVYAMFEMSVGLATLWGAFGNIGQPNEAVYVLLMGAVYLLVRAFDNLSQAFSPDHEAHTRQHLQRMYKSLDWSLTKKKPKT